jgi:hypothetical protein
MLKALSKPKYKSVDASPVKSFFVTMLTRDISLSDAILDLLDNCVDGILRRKTNVSGSRPYHGYKAEIEFNSSAFCIRDNCGGIPWNLHDYAFRMGRPDTRGSLGAHTVGTYGIGMKRAIFKIGSECLISTKSHSDEYRIEIPERWMVNQTDWLIPVQPATGLLKEDGTTISVTKLHKGVSSQFSSADFSAEFARKVATHYAFIIEKGFEVVVNKKSVGGKPTKLIFVDSKKNKSTIRPYIYKGQIKGVDIFMAVGFTRPIPSQETVVDEQEERKYSSLEAGWTVVCNDRAVLYCDKSELTGWGEGSVPQYHTQFIAISGIVEFHSDDPSKLPTTTTKRGIDASSPLYLQVKNRMRDGMLQFTRYTNKWKGDVGASKNHMKSGSLLSFSQLKTKANSLPFTSVRKGIGGKTFVPSLPMPKHNVGNQKRISFVRESDEIEKVGDYLLNDAHADPSVIGERCFEQILDEANK